MVASGPRMIFVPAADVVSGQGVRPGWRPAGADGEAARYGWRLIGANNRELGRSPSTAAGLPEARLAASQVRDRARDLVERVDNDPDNGSWGWTATLDGRLVATSGRRYQRQRECSYNFQQFVLALASAVENLTPTSAQRIRVRRYANPPLPGRERRLPFQSAAPQ